MHVFWYSSEGLRVTGPEIGRPTGHLIPGPPTPALPERVRGPQPRSSLLPYGCPSLLSIPLPSYISQRTQRLIHVLTTAIAFIEPQRPRRGAPLCAPSTGHDMHSAAPVGYYAAPLRAPVGLLHLALSAVASNRPQLCPHFDLPQPSFRIALFPARYYDTLAAHPMPPVLRPQYPCH
jgi:hypothetical protein